MSNASNEMYGPFYYNPIWAIIGVAFLLAAIAVIFMIYYVTRKKEIKSLKNIAIKPPKIIDMNALKAKYLGMIDEVEKNFRARKVKSSVAHQQLSLIVRLFYYEALGFHADVLTLRDLKKSNYKSLTQTIEIYYPNEFDAIQRGSVADAATLARKLVEEQ